MKDVKALLAVVLAVAASLALIGVTSASATTFYNGTTKLPVGATFDLSLSSVFKLTNTSGSETVGECTGSTLKGHLTSAGGAGVPVSSSIDELTWTGCTVATATDAKGGLEFAQIGTSTEGTVKANSEIKWTTNTVFFGICAYGFTAGTDLGKLTTFSSGAAKWDYSAVVAKLSGSNFACPETTRAVATYSSTEPLNLRLEGS